MQGADLERTYAYRVNADDEIVWVSPEWLEFARENEAAELSEASTLGQPLSKFIAGRETRHLYDELLKRVRTTGAGVSVTFRCDSPSRRRFMELRILPGTEGELNLEGRALRIEEREHVPLYDPGSERSDEFVVACGWCKAIQVSENWVEVERAVEKLRLFHASNLPRITHSICPMCTAKAQHNLEDG